MQSRIDAATIRQSIRALDLSGRILCVHASIKSFGFVVGGSSAVLQAFLQEGCTVVAPTFTYECETLPPAGREISRNGMDYLHPHARSLPMRFERYGIFVSREMGALPQELLRTRRHIRGGHPLNSLTAVGSLAEEIIQTQNPLNVYGPYQHMYARGNAWLALLGVDLTKATPIHYAEQRAGRTLFRRWGMDSDGTVVECEAGSCSEGFAKLDPLVAPGETRTLVGDSLWRVFPFREFIDAATLAIQGNPNITRCGEPDCPRCRDAVEGGPILDKQP
jgi:aminoglycoside N3'-acetyltransferase